MVVDDAYSTDQDTTLTVAAPVVLGNDTEAENAYHWDRSDWVALTLDTSWGGDGRVCESEPYSVRVINVSDFSSFVLKSESPTAISLQGSNACSGGEGTWLLVVSAFLGVITLATLVYRWRSILD